MKKALVIFLLLAGAIAASAQGVVPAQGPVFGRVPLEKGAYAELPLGAIRPQGWLHATLQAQADGLTGHLDEVYPDVMGPTNAWLGGDGDAWERGPYWIDGLLPLAYILDDQSLKEKANVWVEAILASQQEDGYIGPSEDHPFVYGLQRGKTHDWWPKMVALKILKQYYMATGDMRVIDCLTRYFRYQAEHLDETPLDHWSEWSVWRAGDNLEVVLWLYDLTGDASLLPLAEKLHRQSVDWTAMVFNGDFWFRQGSVHGVNLAQGIKAPVVWWRYSHSDNDLLAPFQAYDLMRTTAGLPTGLWAADEMLHYGDPSRGSELCTVVEMMFSLEEILRISGRPFYADWLERVAYNALPAQITDDFSAKQYYQQINQIACTRAVRPFSTPHDGTDTMFGTLNGYPCCLSNMHQGWPKLVQNLWYATDDGGLAALVYGPSEVTANVAGGVQVRLTETTDYPFSGGLCFKVDFPKERKKRFSASFPLRLRLPDWATNYSVRINGEEVMTSVENDILCIDRSWKKGDRMEVCFGMEVATETWYDGAVSFVRGPLLYALKMEENWSWVPFDGPDRWYGPGAWQVTTTTPWNWCVLRDSFAPEDCVVEPRFPVNAQTTDALERMEGAGSGSVSTPGHGQGEGPIACDGRGRSEQSERSLPEPAALRSAGARTPWSLATAPLSLRVPLAPLPEWQEAAGSVGPVAYWTEDSYPGDGTTTLVELIPYGCTTLRIAAFPSRIVPWDRELRK